MVRSRSGKGQAAAVDDKRRPLLPKIDKRRLLPTKVDTRRLLPTVIIRGAKRWRVDEAPLKSAVIRTLEKAAPRVAGEVTIVLCDDKEIRRLNKRYRDKDKATDVLSFEVGDGLSAGEPFGDVVVSVETARRQARAYRAPLMEEMQRLIVHGTLHLCGYDHHERNEAARMHGLTRRLLRDLQREAGHS